MSNQIRTFDSGAIRDTNVNKPSYVKALSPVALQYYVDYLGRHRLQSDGGLRDWDNWKSGIPQDVYLDGQGRHFWAVWLLCHGFPAFDNHGPVTLEDSLCGVIFNAVGMLHELLKKEKREKKRDEFEQVGKFTIREARDAGKGWYIIVTKTMGGTGRVPKFLHKDLELHCCTGWDNSYAYGSAPGYYDNVRHAKSYIRMYKNKKFVCPPGWVVEKTWVGSGWYVCKENPDVYLQKDGCLHPDGTGGGITAGYDYGKAPGYWPTKEAAELALAAYLEKESSGKTK